MSLGVEHPWALLLLPLTLIPILFHGQRRLPYSSLRLLPADPLSDGLGVALRIMTALTLALLILAVSGLYRAAESIERSGQGAHIVLLLDRSRSMDEPFGGQGFRHPLATAGYDSKGKVARHLLAEFVANRRNDLFGMLVFSSYPINTLPLTGKQDIIQAAIEAGNIGRGLSKTDVGAGLESALAFFEGQPYRGSRIVLLVSDGAATLDFGTRSRIRNLLRRHRVSLYWVYIRSRNSPGIFAETDAETPSETAPERMLHEFFSKLGTPYRAYTAEDPQALERAIADVNKLQTLPIRYTDLVPRRDWSPYCYALALLMLFVLIVAKFIEMRVWR